MCYSRAEGGQRCIAHAKERYFRAQHAIGVDNTSDKAWQDFTLAEIEYCSTPQGEADIRAQIERRRAAGEDSDSIHAMETSIQRGLHMRERNLAVRNAVRAAAKGVAPQRAAEAGWTFDENAPKFPGEVISPSLTADQALMAAERKAAFMRDASVRANTMRAAAEKAAEEQRVAAQQRAVIEADAARQAADALAAARQAQADRETSGEGAHLNGIPVGGNPRLNPLDGYRAGMNALAGEFGGKGRDTATANAMLLHYAEGTTPGGYPTSHKYAAFQARIERYMTPDQARAAVVANQAVNVLATQIGAGKYTEPATAREEAKTVVSAVTALKRADGSRAGDKETKKATERLFNHLRYSGLSERDQEKWVKEMVRDLSGRNVSVVYKPSFTEGLLGADGRRVQIDD